MTPDEHACADVLRAMYAELGVEVTLHTEAPLIALYEANSYTCPHGVTYWPQPTSEQVDQWRRDGVK